MTSYVQLGPGWRPNYSAGRLHRRRPARRPLIAVLALIGVIFATGLLLGRVEANAPSGVSEGGSQPLQYYSR